MRINISTELEPIFTNKQNKYTIYFSITHTKKAPIHKIKSHFMVYIEEFVNGTYTLNPFTYL